MRVRVTQVRRIVAGLSGCATPARALPVLQTLFVFCSRTFGIYYFVREPTHVEETDLRAPIE